MVPPTERPSLTAFPPGLNAATRGNPSSSTSARTAIIVSSRSESMRTTGRSRSSGRRFICSKVRPWGCLTLIGKLEGVAPLAYRPDGRGEGVDECLGIGIVSLDDFLLGIGKLHFPGFLLRLLLSGCGSVRVISCVLLLCGFRAVMRHVDGAHGRAAGEHQEQAQGDDGKLLVFRHPCFQFLHSRYPFWFPSASPMDSRRQPILFRFGKPNRTGRWCADRSKCYP